MHNSCFSNFWEWFLFTGSKMVRIRSRRCRSDAQAWAEPERFPGTPRGTLSAISVRTRELWVVSGWHRQTRYDHHDVGSENEKPVHTVYLDAYYIDIYQVTNAQYARFLNEYGRNTGDAGNQLLDIDDEECLIEKDGSVYRPKAGYEDHPVIRVSWYGAAAYAQFYGKRLPTEAEWEKAARGGLVAKKYPWGDGITHGDANYSGTGGKDRWDGTSPVGSFLSNGYGLYDMAGNVWEWCADWYNSGYYAGSPRENPTGPSSGFYRVLRGGSCNNDTGPLRCAARYSLSPSSSGYNLGFRCTR